MSYVQQMRALVGRRPLLLVGAGVLVVDEQNRLLLQRRSDDGLWGIPGGGVEPGESVEEAAQREVREETGLAVESLTLFGVFSGPELCHTYPNGDQAAIVSVVYLARGVAGALATSADESLELRYFRPDELPAVPLSPPNRPVAEQFLRATKAPPPCD